MEEKGKKVDIEELVICVEQLQRERDELKKDIEQLCMQQGGSGFLSVATQIHSQRTANLEQDIENLQKRLASCLREKHNLQEELAEAYRIKSHLADLHSAEVMKNKEAEKQVKFFQSCVAAAFAERDQALIECEKVKEREEPLSKKLAELEERIGELQSSCLHEKKLNENLEAELKDLKNQSKPFEEVVGKFYGIRERDMVSSLDTTTEEKCECLLRDPPDNWIYTEDGETSTMKYIASLEEEKDALKRSIDSLQKNLRMGLEIEHHLRRNVRSLEKKQILYEKVVSNKLQMLREFCNHVRLEISGKLEEEESLIKANISGILEKLSQIKIEPECDSSEEPQDDNNNGDIEYKDVHISADLMNDIAQSSNLPTNISNENVDMSKALAQALQEKVATLLLLSQQEERHLLERNMNEALLKKIEELQKNLYQVTNEKVKALMEMAKLKQDIQLLQQDSGNNPRHGGLASTGLAIVKRNQTQEEGKLKSILKRTYLKRWISNGPDEATNIDTKEYSVNFARLKIENATFQESMANMERLTSSIHRLHVLLMKVEDDLKSEAGPSESTYEALSSVITESNLMKTALGSSVLPISWSGNTAEDAITYESLYDSSDASEVSISRSEKADPLSSASLEMVELLILAAETLTERLIDRNATI